MNKEKTDYLDLLAVQEFVEDLAKYCERQFADLQQKMEADQRKNDQLRFDFQEYSYDKNFQEGFKITAYDSNLHFVDYDDVASWQAAQRGDTFRDLVSVTIILNLCYRSGKKSGTMTEHLRKIKVQFKPNASYIEYEHNDVDDEYRDVYQTIVNKLNEFPAVRTIFSKKAA